MPIHRGRNSQGSFYQWGKDVPGRKKWTKYYYTPNDIESREMAKEKAIRQGLASKASQGY